MLNRHETSQFQRRSIILDIVIKYNIGLEYEVTKNQTERLRNEHHLIIEQRELDLRKKLVDGLEYNSNQNLNIRKLEAHIDSMGSDLKLFLAASKGHKFLQSENG